MKKPFQSDRATDLGIYTRVSEIVELCGLRTVAARSLESTLIHPLGVTRGTIVVQEELRGEDEEFALVELVIQTGYDAVCLLDGDDADGAGMLLVVQSDEEGAWIGYCRALAASPTAQMALVPLDPAHDLHLVMGVDGRLERRDGRPAVHPSFGRRIAAARLGRAAVSIRQEGQSLAA